MGEIAIFRPLPNVVGLLSDRTGIAPDLQIVTGAFYVGLYALSFASFFALSRRQETEVDIHGLEVGAMVIADVTAQGT